MKQIFLTFTFIIAGLSLFGQGDYNSKGDMAFQRGDFDEARSWYGEGLNNCDPYSIRQLTEIWKQREELRKFMVFSMGRCFRCLKTMAENRESNDAMFLLSDYYKMGIGVSPDSIQSEYWLKEYVKMLGITQEETTIRDSIYISPEVKPAKKSLLWQNFYSYAGYVYSPTMPIGFTAGVFNRYGFYVSLKIDAHDGDYTYPCNNTLVPAIPIEDPKYEFARKKWNSAMYTGGFVYQLKRNIFLTAGGGYAKREYLREISAEAPLPTGRKSEWCFNVDASYKGLTLEAGGMYEWKKLLLLAGVNTVRFKDLDAYLGLAYTF
ncbi:MAG: hypothetical protein LBR64_00115 [Dysgonamonadaceae bacterium]|jgi:hypothetical protein|nr:hypothetical protein [Dysgonamonadaceae bacterium]